MSPSSWRPCLVLCLALALGAWPSQSMSVFGRSKPEPPPPPTTTSEEPSPAKSAPCPKGIRCVPPIQCPAVVRTPAADRPQLCNLPAGTHGYCCTSGYNHTVHAHSHDHATVSRSARGAVAGDQSHHHHHHHHAHGEPIDRQQLGQIITAARIELQHTLQTEKSQHVPVLTHADPSFFHKLVDRSGSHRTELQQIDQTHRAVERVFAARLYQKQEHIPSVDFQLGRIDAPLYGTPMESGCGQPAPCTHGHAEHALPYRTLDGSCNNPHRSTWGASGSPMQRMLPPAYDDGIWSPREFARDGRPLPNARTASRQLFREVDRPHDRYNLLFMQFGQFLTHDISHSSSITTDAGQSVSCCTADGGDVLPEHSRHWACLPIVIEGDDEFYGPYRQRCMNVVRSALSVDADDPRCSLGYAKQLSKVSHYLDGSAIYGSDAKTANAVRSFRRGGLRVSHEYGRQMMPQTDDPKSCGTERGPCFMAGDGRSNQIITLTVLHTVFVREHNRVANALAELNGHWNDERLFEEARRIVVAQLQHIVYAEWLPYVVGGETMERFRLSVAAGGYSHDYDADIQGVVTSEFTTAAFRFGHSTVDSKFILKKGETTAEVIQIPDVMFESSRLRMPEFLNAIIRSLTEQPMQQVDSAITNGLSGLLFRGHNPFGLDLAAINIQRGRDHGIRPYNDYLEATGHPRVQHFNEFGPENALKLASVYGHPDDIDLWVGGLLEAAHNGDALLGVTFSEIIADQFSRLRRGDRYFYELSPEINPGCFSIDQLQEIRRSSMARLLCNNADLPGLLAMSVHAFQRADAPGNEAVSCDNYQAIGQLNFEPWREVNNYV